MRRLRIRGPAAALVAFFICSFWSPTTDAFMSLATNDERKDAVTARLQELSDEWRDITRLSNEAVKTLIADDQIDILVDLSGHSAKNRLGLFATERPGSVTWLGYPNTTGLRNMDYRLTDAIAIRSRRTRCTRSARCVSPVGSTATDPYREARQWVPPRRRSPFTFGSFNNLLKVTDEVLGCWAGVVKAVPGSDSAQGVPTRERWRA